MARGVVAVVGVGPKLGRSVARCFTHEGYTIAILSRDLDKLSCFADEIAREEKAQVFAIRIDCSEAKRVREAFEGIHSLSFVEVRVYNVSAPIPWNPLKFTDIRLESFEKALTVSAVGAFHCAQQVLPGMIERRKGTILFTGSDASVRGSAGFSELTCGKFALRGLSQCLAREFQPQGIHVAHIIMVGTIGTPKNLANSQVGWRILNMLTWRFDVKLGKMKYTRKVFEKSPEREDMDGKEQLAGSVKNVKADEALKMFWALPGHKQRNCSSFLPISPAEDPPLTQLDLREASQVFQIQVKLLSKTRLLWVRATELV